MHMLHRTQRAAATTLPYVYIHIPYTDICIYLQDAAGRGDDAAVRLLLQAGANASAKGGTDSQGPSALALALTRTAGAGGGAAAHDVVSQLLCDSRAGVGARALGEALADRYMYIYLCTSVCLSICTHI